MCTEVGSFLISFSQHACRNAIWHNDEDSGEGRRYSFGQDRSLKINSRIRFCYSLFFKTDLRGSSIFVTVNHIEFDLQQFSSIGHLYQMDNKTPVTYTRQKLKEIATEPLITMIVTRVYASASVGCVRCDFAIPDIYGQLSVQNVIKTLQSRLTDVSFEQTDVRTIAIDWS